MVTKNSTTITLTGEEQTVQFDRAYPYFWVQNLGDSDVLISVESGIIAGTDGVITVPAGGSCGTMHNYTANADRLYLLGSGRVQVMGTGSAFNPFKGARKGGGSQAVVLNDLIPKNAGARNSTFRGEYLGDTFTTDQAKAIYAGTFDGLFVGDYWKIDDVNYRIAGFNIIPNGVANHAVIVPDKSLYSTSMNDTDTHTYGYYKSKMHTTGLAEAISTIQTAFGADHIITHKITMTNWAQSNGAEGFVIQDCIVALMTERQVYGSLAWGSGDARNDGIQAGTNFSQFPLFALAPEFICIGASWWLSDISLWSDFCAVGKDGMAAQSPATSMCGVRPYFLISASATDLA